MSETHYHVSELPPWDKWLFFAVLLFLIGLAVAASSPGYAGIIIALGALYSEARHIRIVLSKKEDERE